MKYKFLFLAITVVLLAGCGGKGVTFNNKIANIEQSIIPDAQKSMTKITDYIQAQEWDKLAKEAKKTEKEISDKLAELKDVEVPDMEGASAFKKAEVTYLTDLKKRFTCYRKIGEADNDQDRQTEGQNLSQLEQDTETARLDVQQTQKDFAKANKIKMKDEDKTTDDEDKTPKKKKTTDE